MGFFYRRSSRTPPGPLEVYARGPQNSDAKPLRLALGRWLAACGRSDQTRALLAPLVASFGEKTETVDQRDACDLLSEVDITAPRG